MLTSLQTHLSDDYFLPNSSVRCLLPSKLFCPMLTSLQTLLSDAYFPPNSSVRC
jgi:hypothetical protein